MVPKLSVGPWTLPRSKDRDFQRDSNRFEQRFTKEKAPAFAEALSLVDYVKNSWNDLIKELREWQKLNSINLLAVSS